MTKSEWLSVNEASIVTSLKPSTLRRLASQRRLTSYKISGALRFRRCDLEKLIVKRPAKVVAE